MYFKNTKYYNVIKQALMSKSNAERCWEIVVKKNVNLLVLRNCTKVEEYNKRIIEWQGQDKLTEEEFELLKCEVGK